MTTPSAASQETAPVVASSASAEQLTVGEWSLAWAGWPLWLVVPLALVVAWGVAHFYRAELAGLPALWRRSLRGMRFAAVFLVILLLSEPSCTRVSQRTLLPEVAVLVDDSQSMAVTDSGMAAARRLDEAEALELLDPALRDRRWAQLGAAVEELGEQLGQLPALLDAGPGTIDDATRAALPAAIAQVEAAAEALAEAEATLPDGVAALTRTARQAVRLIEPPTVVEAEADEDDQELPPPEPEAVADACRQQALAARALQVACRERQEGGDAAWVDAAPATAPVSEALRQLAGLSRLERLRRLLDGRLSEAVGDRASLRLHRLRAGLPAQDLATELDLAGLASVTDPTTPLRELAQLTADRPLAGVLIASDGRFTSGGDPRPAARALQARGAPVHGIWVGDVEPPRDAVVGAILGAREVFRGETIRLDVRYRITGYPEQAWDLVLTRDGETYETRTVVGDGSWQVERFELPAEEAGVERLSASLRPAVEAPPAAVASGLSWERYPRPDDLDQLLDLDPAVFAADPRDRQLIEGPAEAPDGVGDNYLARWRGWIVPPATGLYRFALSADDRAVLWLSTDGQPEHRSLIARVPDWTEPGEYDRHQQQRSEPVSLRAGQAYWLEIWHVQGGGGDHCQLAWQLPDGGWQAPLPTEVCRPWQEGVDGPPQPEADIEPADTEAEPENSQDNNRNDMAVIVHEDPLRALVVDAQPRWDSRYLVALFERDRRVDVDRRYRSTIEADDGRLLPRTQEELDGYDLVALGDLRPDELLPEDQARLAAFVQDRGGFLIVQAGPRGMPAAYSLGPLAEILPVTIRGPTGGKAADRGQQVGLRLTEPGAQHAVTAILEDPTLNQRLWPALPPLGWVAPGLAAKAGAEVLVETADDDRPLIVLGRSGAGRVCLVASDETWRWRDRLGDRVHQAFWLQAVRWGLAEGLRGADPRLQVSLDRLVLAPGEAAELRARVVDSAGRPIDVAPRLLIERLAPDGSVAEADADDPDSAIGDVLELTRVTDAAGLWRRGIGPLPRGDYRLSVTADHPDLDGLVEHRQLIVRQPVSRETRDLAADPAALARLTAAGGGSSGSLLEAERILEALTADLEPERRREVETIALWNTYWVLVVIAGLLGVEWFVRKRLGLP